MFLSIFLAKVIGLYFIIVGALYIFRKDYIKEVLKDWFQHPAISVIGGILALIIGLLIVVSHNVWVLHWPVVITIVGYLSLFKGLWRLFIPDAGKEIMEKFFQGQTNAFVGIVTILIGIWLTYTGFSI